VVLAEDRMPGRALVPGRAVNYARQVFRHAAHATARATRRSCSSNEWMHEDGCSLELSWLELQRQVAVAGHALRGLGVQPGDRVCAYLPNVPQAMVAFLACASPGRDLVDLLARHGAGGGARPLPPDRTRWC
jgi:acetoacetyl-CoA synthetase